MGIGGHANAFAVLVSLYLLTLLVSAPDWWESLTQAFTARMVSGALFVLLMLVIVSSLFNTRD